MSDVGGWARLDPLVARLLDGDPARVLVIVAPGGAGTDEATGAIVERLGRSRIDVVRWRGRRLEREQPAAAIADLLGMVPEAVEPVAARMALLERLGPGGALVVDDAQWLDPVSLGVLVAVAERAPDHDLRVVVARRLWPTGPELATLDLTATATGAVVEWGPLTAVELADRLDRRGPASSSPADLAAIARATGGEPWLVDAVADVEDRVAGAGDVPDAVVSAVRARAGSLSSSARALLLARALVGAAAPAVEADALGIDLPALGEAWGEARSEGLFARDGTAVDDDRLLPLVARALRRAVPAPEQAEVVRRVDEARARAGMASVEVVRALDALERGRSDDALVAADRIRAAPDTSDPDRDLAVWLSVTVLSGRGLHSDAEAVAGSQGTPRSRELAAFVRLLGGTPPDELPGGDERAPVADLVLRRTVEGLHQSVVGRPDDALALLSDAVDLAELHPPAFPMPESPHGVAALVALAALDLPRATRFLQRALDHEVGGMAGERHHRMLAAWVDVRAGRTGRAVAEVRALEREWPTGLTAGDRLLAAAIEVGVARRAGDVALLTEVWGRVKPVLLGTRADLFGLSPIGELCAAAVRLGADEAARPVLAQAEGVLAAAGRPALWTVPLRWDALQAASIAGDAETTAELAATLAGADVELPAHEVVRRAARVWVALLDGTVSEDAVAAAAEELSGIGLAWEASHLVGQAAVRSTDSRVTRALLGRARDLKGAVGAEPERLAADTGLSERELEIGLLVRDGLTHREIGERLFISPKTVEHHVARIRQKLGATSRAEMLAALAQIAGR